MTIRFARADDHWRRTFLRNYSARYHKLAYKGLFCLKDGDITFRAGLSAIVGGNGVGKSTVIAAMIEAIGADRALAISGHEERLNGSELVAGFQDGGTEKTRRVTGLATDRQATGDPVEADVSWVDPALLSMQSRVLIVKDSNFADLIEPVTPHALTADELSLISYLVGKVYTRCEVYEVEEFGGFDRFPYFKVTSHGVNYGSESMGQGELALLIIYWALRDLSKNSILILEEPETHVSPRSQDALMNVVAKFCDEKGIWVIVTTHSPVIIRNIPRGHVKLLSRDDESVQVIENPHLHQLAAVLGGGAGFKGTAVVEDKLAAEYLLALLRELSPDLARHYEIVPAGSESDISAALKGLPRTGSWFSLVGVYDGDQRGKIDSTSFHWPHFFFPGGTSLEQELRKCIDCAEGRKALAIELRVQAQDIAPAFDAVAGLDGHDWFSVLATELGAGRETAIRAMLRVWLRAEGRQAAAEALVADLASAV